MNSSLENPFRNPAQRATKRLFKDRDKLKSQTTKNTKEKFAAKLDHTLVNYGPYKILYPQVQFLKEIEKLIPEEILAPSGQKKKTAQEKIILRLTKLNFDEKGNLVRLNLEQLGLTSLPKPPKSLKKLLCGFNQLTSLPPLPPALIEFDCKRNQLTQLPQLPKTLRILNCLRNQLSSLPQLPPNLQILHCENNCLTNLPELPPGLLGITAINGNSLTDQAIKAVKLVNKRRR